MPIVHLIKKYGKVKITLVVFKVNVSIAYICYVNKQEQFHLYIKHTNYLSKI